MFDGEVSDMGKLSQSVGGEVVVSLNGGHSKTEEIIAKSFKVPNQPFVESNFEKIIADYEAKLRSGEISKNDQLMLMINTHGAENYGREKTHNIAYSGAEMKDLNTGAGARTVSLDKLETIAKLAEEKGVKLAIIDLSCHSGNTLPLKNSKTCVITSSGPNHYGYGGSSITFPRRLFKYMNKGVNLEDAFIKARSATWDLSFPMISTDVGLEINEKLYTPLTPYLFYTSSNANKLTPYIRREVVDGCVTCQNESQMEAIRAVMEEARAFQAVAKNAKFTNKEAQNLEKAIKDYNDVQIKLKEGLKSLNIPDLKKSEKFCSERERDEIKWVNNKIVTVKKMEETCTDYTIREIMYGNFEWSKEFYKKNANVEMNDFYGAQYKIIELVEKKKAELALKHPDLKKWETYFDDQKLLTARTYKLAMNVAYASQHLYEALYNQKRSDKSNPCKDFVL